MEGGLLVTEFRGRVSVSLLPPVISPAQAGGGCVRCPPDAPSHLRDPMLHLLTTPAHVCLLANIPFPGKTEK